MNKPLFKIGQKVKARNHKGFGIVSLIRYAIYDGKAHYRYNVVFENNLSTTIKKYCEFELKEYKEN